MGYILLFLTLLSAGVVIVLQLKYARANYPSSLRWRSYLFGSAFIGGFLCAITLLHEVATSQNLVVTAIVGGLFFGVGFTFLSPSGMQYIYPKREEPDGDTEKR